MSTIYLSCESAYFMRNYKDSTHIEERYFKLKFFFGDLSKIQNSAKSKTAVNVEELTHFVQLLKKNKQLEFPSNTLELISEIDPLGFMKLIYGDLTKEEKKELLAKIAEKDLGGIPEKLLNDLRKEEMPELLPLALRVGNISVIQEIFTESIEKLIYPPSPFLSDPKIFSERNFQNKMALFCFICSSIKSPSPPQIFALLHHLNRIKLFFSKDVSECEKSLKKVIESALQESEQKKALLSYSQESFGNLLLATATFQFEEIALELMQAGISLIEKNAYGSNILHLAVRGDLFVLLNDVLNHCNPELLQEMFSKKEMGNEKRETPLHLALEKQEAKYALALLAKGASLNEKTIDGKMTGFDLALIHGKMDVVFQYKEQFEKTSIHKSVGLMALENKYSAAAIWFIDHGGEITYLLGEAIKGGFLEVVKKILDHPRKEEALKVRDGDGNTPILLACQRLSHGDVYEKIFELMRKESSCDLFFQNAMKQSCFEYLLLFPRKMLGREFFEKLPNRQLEYIFYLAISTGNFGIFKDISSLLIKRRIPPIKEQFFYSLQKCKEVEIWDWVFNKQTPEAQKRFRDASCVVLAFKEKILPLIEFFIKNGFNLLEKDLLSSKTILDFLHLYTDDKKKEFLNLFWIQANQKSGFFERWTDLGMIYKYQIGQQVILIVRSSNGEKRPFGISKSILRARSPFFKEHIPSEKIKVCQLNIQTSLFSFEKVLYFIYSGTIEIDPFCFEEIASLANQFQLDGLKHCLNEWIEKNHAPLLWKKWITQKRKSEV